MIEVNPISQAFVKLGDFLLDFCEDNSSKNLNWKNQLEKVITIAEQHNGWFTKQNIRFSLQQWGNLLTKENLGQWLSNYNIKNKSNPRTIAIIMAGNIPLVGFHDFICVLLSGNKVLAKLSSNDKVVLPFLADFLIETCPELNGYIKFTEEKLENFDAVIATGSNNTGRYFEYYFGKYPNIIRKNRSSVAVLTGKESQEELKHIGEDIFRYFGLGCRSVSKLFVPKGYDFKRFFEAIFDYQEIMNNSKYANNYDYNKAVYLMSDYKLFDNNFIILKEDKNYGSPIGTLFYEYYKDLEKLDKRLQSESEGLQCIVSKSGVNNSIPLGTTQKPNLNDYADGVDTLKFLLKL